jgi:hypothetical protein
LKRRTQIIPEYEECQRIYELVSKPLQVARMNYSVLRKYQYPVLTK